MLFFHFLLDFGVSIPNLPLKYLPVKLVYYEEHNCIDEAFYREKQVQGWSRRKKIALINSKEFLLPELSLAYKDLKKTDI